MADYVKRLKENKWYPRMMGNYLPGDITCFEELTRVVPNTYVAFSNNRFIVNRFYPNQNIKICQDDAEKTT
jgi:hypothetical protein